MTYETMDWEAELRRVVAAFDVVGECELFLYADNNERGLVQGEEKHAVCRDGLLLLVGYEPEIRDFSLGDKYHLCFMKFDWNNKVLSLITSFPHSFELARGLYCLGLLTPDAESMLKVTISEHQKIEWTLQYEERLKANEHQ